MNTEVPVVDVIIPVHTEDRPIHRALVSVLEHTEIAVRILVVAHNVAAEKIARSLAEYRGDPRVEILEYFDGIFSPAGPKNYAIAHVTAPYVCFLDSDDTLEPGALDEWYAVVEPGDPLTVVIAPMRTSDGLFKPVPPIRLGSWRQLDPIRDRLSYRSAPMGLLPTILVRDLRFPEGRYTGEDQEYSLSLWFSRATIAFPYRAAGYVEHHDALQRVTETVRPVNEELVEVDSLIAAVTQTPFARQNEHSHRLSRQAVLVQHIRTHMFNAVHRRLPIMAPEDRRLFAERGEHILSLEPDVLGMLSKDEAQLFHALLRPSLSDEEISQRSTAVRNIRPLGALLPHRVRYMFHPLGPMRFHLSRRRLIKAGAQQ